MISHLPALYATADVAQQEADLRNNTARHKPAKDKTAWHKATKLWRKKVKVLLVALLERY